MSAGTNTYEQKLLSAISTCRDQHQLTDLVLKHKDGNLNVHKIIVFPQSSVICKACSGDDKGLTTSLFEINDMSYFGLQTLVKFFYSLDYDYHGSVSENTKTMPSAHPFPLQFHARMFALGHHYDVHALRDVASKKYSSAIECSEPLEFIASIPDVYGKTPQTVRELRDLVCQSMRSKVPQIFELVGVNKAYQTIIHDVPEFAGDLLDTYVRTPPVKDCPPYDPSEDSEPEPIFPKRRRRSNRLNL